MLTRQKGMTTVEFAIIGMLFFIILFGIVEVGRALFVWNGLADITRRAARIGAVCPPNDVSIIRTAIYNDAGNGGSSSRISGLDPSHVTVRYLDSTLTVLPNPATTDFSSVKYVQASIDTSANGYKHQMLIPTFNITLTPPNFATTVPAESLGRWEDAAGDVFNGCYLP